MKTTTLMIMLATLFTGSINAQDANMKRTMLFTLSANEEIYYGEYFVLQQLNQNRFACIIKDTVKKTYIFVFNGKRIVTGDRRKYFSYIHLDVHYLNVHEENGYAVEYNLQDMGYANIKGKVYGPFDEHDGDSHLVFAKDSEGNPDCDRFYYRKTENGNRNYYIHCNDAKEGPFDEIRFPEKTSAYANSEYLYLLAGKWYAHYGNGNNKMTSLVYGYMYSENGKWHVNINHRNSRGYDDIENLHFTESGQHAYIYKENEKEHVNINGTESRNYASVSHLRLIENGKYAYIYGENGRGHVNINGTESRGYYNIENLYFTESGKYAYKYRENEKWHVNINGAESRGYDGVWYLHFTESGKYAYEYRENGKYHININGAESRGYESVGYLRFTESGKYAFWYKENGKEHVNINGAESRGYDALGTDRYHSFYFTASGKYAYKYKENGKWHVNVNGRDSGNYDKSYEIVLADDTNGSVYYPNNDGKIYKNDNGQETEYLSSMLWANYRKPAFFGNRNYDSGTPPALEIYSTEREHSLYSSYEYEYVVVDGKRHGHSPALYAWYDKTKNAFVWNAVEGRELVLYEYKL
ncbi:MAG: hypothetical protein LBK12_00430 [Odoribacteraceae bacterium]|nr:hypothetical protein [Odoribacteraceae bacterium]